MARRIPCVNAPSSKAGYPKRGEIWWVAFDPSVGGEIQKTRPAVVVSNNEFNATSNRMQVVPLTSNVKALYPAECFLTVALSLTEKKNSKAVASQVTTVAKQRLKAKISVISKQELKTLEQAIALQLGL